MTRIVESQPKSLLYSLRDALKQAEQQIVRLDGSNIKEFLVGLDQIEQMFTEYAQDKGLIRAEVARWERISRRIETRPGLVNSAATAHGGLIELRSQHPPAAGPWWHSDTEIASRRNQLLKRTRILIIIGTIVVVALLWWGIAALNLF